MTIRLWGILAILLCALAGLSWWTSKASDRPEMEALKTPTSEELNSVGKPKEQPKVKSATRQPGRVVVLNTSRGAIEFVLYEKDCPKTTKRIAELAQSGAYNGVGFPRVEPWVIQTDKARKDVPPMGIEVAKGLTHAKGSVGMARPASINMNTSVFYITTDPAPHLDMQYTNFGRVIKGMDVVMKIKIGDKIKTAAVRPFTAVDRKRFNEVLQVEAERRTQ